jgi:hypothetical protein
MRIIEVLNKKNLTYKTGALVSSLFSVGVIDGLKVGVIDGLKVGDCSKGTVDKHKRNTTVNKRGRI